MPQPAGHKLVIVEDEGLIAADLSNRLEDAGYVIAGIADSGSEAPRLIRETAPDLVLMDIRIKGAMDGIETARRVAEDFDIPVVFLTAYEDPQTLERAGCSHAFGYIKKPIASAGLCGPIEMAVAKHQQENRLREQRDWLNSSFGALSEAVVATDGLGRVSYRNRVAEELTGCPADAPLGGPASELLRFRCGRPGEPVEQMRPLSDLVPAVMLRRAAMPLPPDTCLLGEPDRISQIEGSVLPRLTANGIDGTLFVFRDVSMRKFVEEQCREESKQAALKQAGGRPLSPPGPGTRSH